MIKELPILERPRERALVDGIDIQKNPLGWSKLIGYVPQGIYLSDTSIREALSIPFQQTARKTHQIPARRIKSPRHTGGIIMRFQADHDLHIHSYLSHSNH